MMDPSQTIHNEDGATCNAAASLPRRHESGEEEQHRQDHGGDIVVSPSAGATTGPCEDSPVRTTHSSSSYFLTHLNGHLPSSLSSSSTTLVVTSLQPPVLETRSATQQDDVIIVLLNHNITTKKKEESLFSLFARIDSSSHPTIVKYQEQQELSSPSRLNYRPLLQIIDSALEIVEESKQDF